MTEGDGQAESAGYNDAAVWEFHRQHARHVRNYLHRMGTPAEVINDIVIDAFLALRLRWNTLDSSERRAYLFAVAWNQRNARLREHIERNNNVVVGLPEEFDTRLDGPLTAPDCADGVVDLLALQDLLARLLECNRDAIVLHKIIGLSLAETARVLGCPVGTVKARVSRGLKVLRAHLNVGEEAKEL